jgi:hypothetical protein
VVTPDEKGARAEVRVAVEHDPREMPPRRDGLADQPAVGDDGEVHLHAVGPPDVQHGRRWKGREVAVDDARRHEPHRLAPVEAEQALELAVLPLGQRGCRGLETGLLELLTKAEVFVPQPPVPGEP